MSIGTYHERDTSPAGSYSPCYMTDLSGVITANYWNTCILGYYNAIGGPVAGANVLANCTGYAQGRILECWVEVTGNNPTTLGTHPFVSLHDDAKEWYDIAQNNGLTVSRTPSNGSIICWGQGTDPDSRWGHVGFVEKVVNSTTIITTESGYGGIAGREWIRQTRTWNGSNWVGDQATMGGYAFQGFINNPADPDPPEPPGPQPPTPGERKKSKWIYYLRSPALYRRF